MPEVKSVPSGDELPATFRESTETTQSGIATPPAPPKPTEPREWEQILGGNWLARIGVVTLIIGVAFFLKFAFDNNWLGPIARVIME